MTAETMEAPAVAAPTATPPHPLREFWGYFSANHGAVAGLVVIVAVVLVALLADVLAPHSPYLTNTADRAEAAVLAGGRHRSPIRSAPTRSAATSSPA